LLTGTGRIVTDKKSSVIEVCEWLEQNELPAVLIDRFRGMLEDCATVLFCGARNS